MPHVLLAICGRTPQVITETLYALHQQGKPVDILRVLTTNPGKALCNAHLFDAESGKFFAFLSDFNIPEAQIDFGPHHIQAVQDEHGRTVEDIATEADNEAFLKACMDKAWKFTASPENTVSFSIAGGRKTMGACMALAAQFYARKQDRIYHVLVAPEFENCPDFFYPPPQSRYVELRDARGNPYFKETRYAWVNLVPLPFVSVRDRLDDGMLQTPEAPAALLSSIVRETRPQLIIDLNRLTLTWNGMEADLPPAQLALYAFFAQIKKRSDCHQDTCSGCQQCFLTIHDIQARQAELAEIYEARIAIKKSRGIESDTGITSLNQENFNSYRSKINKAIEKAFGGYQRDILGIQACGPHGTKRYGIPLERNALRLHW